jgi:hypothetical protein
LVVCIKPGSDEIENENFLAVVDTMDDNLNMLIVKMCMKLGKVEDLTTRQKKVTGLMKVKTDWVVLRICSL